MVNTGTIKVIEDQSVMIFSGKVLARDVPYEEYLAGGFGQHTEWAHTVRLVEGMLED